MGQVFPLLPGLFAGMKVAFEHEAHDGLAPLTELAKDFASDEALAPMVFMGVIMGTVDHDRTRDAFSRDRCLGPCDMLLVVVGFPAAAWG